jgi:hypothetical protein
LFKPNLKNMNVHSATCSCSIELYKQWYTLADFLPNWDISRGFLYISLIHREDQRSCDGQGNIIFFKVPRSPFIREGEIGDGEMEEGGCE